jgi:hypothetical protein
VHITHDCLFTFRARRVKYIGREFDEPDSQEMHRSILGSFVSSECFDGSFDSSEATMLHFARQLATQNSYLSKNRDLAVKRARFRGFRIEVSL